MNYGSPALRERFAYGAKKAGMADERWLMSKIELFHRKTPKLSAAFRKFWGAPPLLGFEGEEAYWSFAAAIVADMDPPDVVTLVLVKDFVDLSFQIRELRKHKGRLMELERARKLGTVLPKEVKAFAKHYLSPVGETELFLASMEFFAAIDQLIGNMERRRKDALAEVEFYREAVAIRLRRNAAAADAAMIEGNVVETEIGSTSESATADGARAAAVEDTASTLPNEAATQPPATNNPEVADDSVVTGRAVVVDLPVAADVPVAAGDCPELAATEHKALEPAAAVQSDGEDKPAAG
jgi:hypothetical protein